MLRITNEIKERCYAFAGAENVEEVKYRRIYYSKALNVSEIMGMDIDRYYEDSRTNSLEYKTCRNEKDGIDYKTVSVRVNKYPVSFDIETNPDGTSWVQTFTIDDTTIVCRGWKETEELIAKMCEVCESISKSTRMGRGKNKTVTHIVLNVLIANLSFEYQYLRKRVEMIDTFSTNARKPLYATSFHFMFTDPLRVSNSSLAKLSSIYNLPTKKKVYETEDGKKISDLDYEIYRTTKWKMSEAEFDYVCSDTEVLADFGRWCYKNYTEKGLDVPLTATGIVRNVVKDFARVECQTEVNIKGKNRKFPNDLGKKITKMFPPTLKRYNELMDMTFVGGYTKSSMEYTGIELSDVNGGDFTSSYPTVMMFKKFPMTPFRKWSKINLKKATIADILNNADKIASIVKIRFKGLKPLTAHSIQSVSKCYEYNECGKKVSECIRQHRMIIDNGRVYRADQLTVSLTEQDLITFSEFYEWSDYEILSLEQSYKDYLPDFLRHTVAIYYQKKAELKRAGLDGTTEYRIAKAMVNACYGMMCEKIHIFQDVCDSENGWSERPKITNGLEAGDLTRDMYELMYKTEIYGIRTDGETIENIQKQVDAVERGTKLTGKFLSPYWAVYVTAYARRNLLANVYKCHKDVIYCDTDSMYFIDRGNARRVMDEWNEYTYRRNKDCIDEWNKQHGFDENRYYETKDEEYKDNTCGWLSENLMDLGEFDVLNKHGNYTRFKTLGCKRYLKTSLVPDKKTGELREKTEITVAGLPKSAFYEYIEQTGKDPYEVFTNGMEIKNCKKTHTYIDEEYSAEITDMQGNTETMTEKSSLVLEKCDFTLKLSDEYAFVLNNVAPIVRKNESDIIEMIEAINMYDELCERGVYKKHED